MDEVTIGAVRAALAANVPAILWGPPGTAKTAMVEAEAQRLGLTCHTVNLSHYEPAEVNGWLVPDAAVGVMRRLPPDWLADACERPCLLFLDELSCAAPAVQAAALRLVQERRVGDRALHPGTRVVCAANPADQASGGWDLSAPLANRLVHIAWEPDFATWASWLASRGPGDPSTRGVVVGYLQKSGVGTHFCSVPRDEAGASAAWPSPRSWTNLCACLSVAQGSLEVETLLAEGCVGGGEAAAFLAYRREQDLPDPEELLKDPDGWAIPARHDRAYAALAGVVAAVSSHLTPARWQAAVRLHRLVSEAGIADLAAASAMPLFRWKLGPSEERRKEIAKATISADDMRPFEPLLKAAKLIGGSK